MRLILVSPSYICSGCKATLILSTLSSQNVCQRGIVGGCWQYAYSYEILELFINHRINLYWSQISFSWNLSFTMRNVHGLTWITYLRLKQTKSENNSLSELLLFYRLWHIFYSPIFGNYERLSFWCKWKQASINDKPIFNYILAFL